MSEEGYMEPDEVEEWLQDWIQVPGLVTAMQQIENRTIFVTSLMKSLGVMS